MGQEFLPIKKTSLIFAPLFILQLFTSGCFWMAVGGAGAEAGYVAGQDKRTASQTVSDQWIFTKVKAELLAADEVSSGKITVTVRKGVVTLAGVPASALEKDKALAAARGVKGVRRVKDQLFLAQ